MSQPAPSLRAISIRVALAATVLVGVVYLAIAVAVWGIVTSNLTRQIDDDLSRTLGMFLRVPLPGGAVPEWPGPQRPFGPQVLAWAVAADGTVLSNTESADLPAEYQDASAPQTISIEGTQVRIRGADAGSVHVVIGQTMDAVAQAESNLVVAELAIAPGLLLAVFLGAVAIGRRVASPIELARRRQLEFTADASHELRTPLSVIEAQTSLALAQARSPDWYRTAFGRVETEGRRMHRLVDDLLWLARFDAAQDAPPAEPVDLGLLATGAADRFGVVAEARHLDLAVSVPAEPVVITAPPEWLDRLLGVLLDNACRYSPEGGRVTVTVDREGGRAAVTVDDSGPGITPARRERIFDRFHRATDAPGGAGLGLAIANAIVQATNGRWRIGTSAAGGASMSVSWPVQRPA